MPRRIEPFNPSAVVVAYGEERKKLAPNAILVVKVGDFYEAFRDDARSLCSIAGLVVTSRDGLAMAGFPYHTLESIKATVAAAGRVLVIREWRNGQILLPLDNPVKKGKKPLPPDAPPLQPANQRRVVAPARPSALLSGPSPAPKAPLTPPALQKADKPQEPGPPAKVKPAPLPASTPMGLVAHFFWEAKVANPADVWREVAYRLAVLEKAYPHPGYQKRNTRAGLNHTLIKDAGRLLFKWHNARANRQRAKEQRVVEKFEMDAARLSARLDVLVKSGKHPLAATAKKLLSLLGDLAFQETPRTKDIGVGEDVVDALADALFKFATEVGTMHTLGPNPNWGECHRWYALAEAHDTLVAEWNKGGAWDPLGLEWKPDRGF